MRAFEECLDGQFIIPNSFTHSHTDIICYTSLLKIGRKSSHKMNRVSPLFLKFER